MNIERGNILSATKCAVRDLLDVLSSRQKSVIDFDDGACENDVDSLERAIVVRLLCCIDNGLCHGLPPSKTTLAPDPWPILSQMCSNAVLTQLNQIEEVKTGLGKTRLWIRKVLMSKQLGTLLRQLIDKLDAIHSTEKSIPISPSSQPLSKPISYLPGALLTSDDGANFAGLLLGLNVVDFCFILKDNLDRFDRPLEVIDYKSCIKLDFAASSIDSTSQAPSENGDKLSNLIDQKNYLEETLASTQSRLEKVTAANRELASKLAQCVADRSTFDAKTLEHAVEVQKLRDENTRLSNLLIRQSKEVQSDLKTVRDTFKISSSVLDDQNAGLQRQLQEEMRLRTELQKSLVKETELRFSLEADRKLTQQISAEQQQCFADLRSYNADLMNMNQNLTIRVSQLTEELENARQTASKLQQKVDGMNDVINAMDERFSQLKEKAAGFQKALHQANTRASSAEQRVIQIETDLQVSKEEVLTCTNQLDELSLELNHLESLRKQVSEKDELLSIQEAKLASLTQKCTDQEISLQEMGIQVQTRILEAASARERVDNLHEARWRPDEETEACYQCATPFTISRRKHHCRSCGFIFCYQCSAYQMPLPSSSKPVRVCELCHNQLLERYSAK